MKPFTEYFNDKLIQASQNVLSGHNLVEEKTMKIVATDDYGAIRKGTTFTVTAKTNNMGQTRLVIPDKDMPRATMGPTLFLGKDGKPDGYGQWNRFEIVEASEIDKNFRLLMNYSKQLSQLIAMTGGSSTIIGRLLIDELGAGAKTKLASVRNKLIDAEEFDALGAEYSAATSMESVEESTILEASSDQLDALSKVMLSMGASYGDINDVRSKLDSEVSGKFLLALATTIANDTDAFNAFVKAQTK
jgi:hypothetical protein